MNILFFSLTKMLSVCPQQQQQQQRAAGERVWSRTAPADEDAGHESTARTQILHSWHELRFQHSCLRVSQACSGSRVSNWPLNNKVVAVNQPITNKRHLVSAACARCSAAGTSHCHFTALKLPERSKASFVL